MTVGQPRSLDRRCLPGAAALDSASILPGTRLFGAAPLGAARETYFPGGVAVEFASLRFRCARVFSHPDIDASRAFVPDDTVLFGSDYPSFRLNTPPGRSRRRNYRIAPAP